MDGAKTGCYAKKKGGKKNAMAIRFNRLFSVSVEKNILHRLFNREKNKQTNRFERSRA